MSKKIHMIGNSHIDPVWLWQAGEGFQEVKSTFASALDRMEEFPEFIFSASSIAFYKWVEENMPDMFKKIEEKVKEGRWEIVGGWWIEPDCNIPAGESLVRQALYSQRYLKDKFGKIATVGYNVDSFGHDGMLPQILKKSGIDSYVVMRPHKELLELPGPLFRWRSKDGSEVTGCRLEGEYSAWTKVALMRNLNNTLEEMDKAGLEEMACFYGVGNHGGGPTIENIKSIREIDVEHKDLDVKCNTLEKFFDSVHVDKLPLFQKELQRIFIGCYSVDSQIKKLNRFGENLAIKSERFAAIASMLGNDKYPKGKIENMWELILFNQFHDILAGTSREEGRNEAVEDFHSALSLGRRILNNSLQAIANRIDTRGEGFPLIVFNPNSYEVDEMITVDIYWHDRKPIRLKDSNANEIVYQKTKHEALGGDSRQRLIFKAKIPAMGYGVYRLVQENPLVKGEVMKIQDFAFENEKVKVIFNKETGKVSSIVDKLTGYEALKNEISVKLYKDERDTWGAAGPSDELLGEFKLVSIRVEEEGVNRSTVRVIMAHEDSILTQYYYLYKDAGHLVVKNRLNSRAKHKLINLSIPVNVEVVKFRGETPYGFEDRTCFKGEEYYAHSYMRVFDGEKESGLIIANDSKYGYRMYDNEYQLILSRSSIFARGSGSLLEEDMEYRFADQGELEFVYALKPHGMVVENIEGIKLANNINIGLEYLADNIHIGSIPVRYKSFIGIDKANVIVNVVKQSEDGDGFILRMYETERKDTVCRLTFLDKDYELYFTGCEIKTVKVDAAGNLNEVNMLEF